MVCSSVYLLYLEFASRLLGSVGLSFFKYFKGLTSSFPPCEMFISCLLSIWVLNISCHTIHKCHSFFKCIFISFLPLGLFLLIHFQGLWCYCFCCCFLFLHISSEVLYSYGQVFSFRISIWFVFRVPMFPLIVYILSLIPVTISFKSFSTPIIEFSECFFGISNSYIILGNYFY